MIILILPTNCVNNSNGSEERGPDARSFSIGIEIGPNQTSYGKFGDIVTYKLTIVNNQTVSDYIDITYETGPSKWAVSIFQIDGSTLLRDSAADNDGIPDTGLLAPSDFFEFIVKVTVPQNQPFNEPEVTTVSASSSLSPAPHVGRCNLITKAYPYIDATKFVSHKKIYEEAAEPLGFNTKTRVTLNIKGGGVPTIIERYHDVVFLIDNTGSMTTNDPTKIRLDAANSYVNNMTFPDQGAVVTFYGTAFYPRGFAWIARGPNNPVEHLSSNFQRIKDNINWTGNMVTGGTNILKAMELGNNELINFGNPQNVKYIILLTDGYDSGNFSTGDRDDAIRQQAQVSARNDIVVFTIGLGSSANTPLLNDIANITKGKYYSAENASQLMEIYNEIQLTTSKVAGRDPYPADDISMVREVLPEHIHFMPDSFRIENGSIPFTAFPSLIEHNPANTTFHWNVEKLLVNQSLIISFNISSSKTGWVPVGLYPDARVHYTDWSNDTEYDIPFPEVWIEVLPIPRPDVIPVQVAVNGEGYDPKDNIFVERGENVTISASAKNIGELSTEPFAPEFIIAIVNASQPGSPFFSNSIEKLEVNALSSEFTAVWYAPFTLDDFVISIVVDFYDSIPEGASGEANNVFNITVNVVHNPSIDLIPVDVKIDSVLISNQSQNTFEVEVDSELKIELQVENSGNENTNYFASEFYVALSNRSTSEDPIELRTIYSLSAGARSRALIFLWQGPSLPGVYELEIIVDNTNLIPEGTAGEINNKVSFTIKVVKDIFIDIKPYSFTINSDQKKLEDISPTNVYLEEHELLIGQPAAISFQVISNANEPSRNFAPEFGIKLYNITDAEEISFFRTTITNLEPDEVSDTYVSHWRAPLTPGSYFVILEIDYNDALSEENGGEDNNLVYTTFKVFDLPEPPELTMEVDSDNQDIKLKWDIVENAVTYEIFGGEAPSQLDLNQPLGTFTDLSWTHISVLSGKNQFYYTIRAVDERGWAGPTGSIIGFYTKQFSPGYNTFSLPLEPFEKHSADWYAEEMLSSDFETLYYYDETYQSWIGHPKFLPAGIDDFEIQKGKSYMLYTASEFSYTFSGRPETMLRFVPGSPDFQWLGGGADDHSFRTGLSLTKRQSGIQVDWQAVKSKDGAEEKVKYYEVYRSTGRERFELPSTGSYDEDNSSIELIATTRLNKYIDSEIPKLLESNSNFEFLEFHYIVVPINEQGRRGGSTYSRSITVHELESGYNTFGYSLIGSTISNSYDFIIDKGSNDVDTIYYYDSEFQKWVGHPRFLPAIRDNPKLKIAEGYMIYILADTTRHLYLFS